MRVDEARKTATIKGITPSCEAEIMEELARTKDGRKNYGWEKKYGHLSIPESGTLVITDMPDEAVKEYEKLRYKKEP